MKQEHSKLVLTLNGNLLNEVIINDNDITIGRKSSNNIRLDELTVSGNHSIIQIHENETYIKDEASTNGTLLNGVRITKSLLKHGDIIQIGNYQFAYQNAKDEYKPSMFIKAEFESTTEIELPTSDETNDMPIAGVRVLNGPLESKVLELRKPLNTIGFNGKKLAIVSRNPDGYTISALHDDKFRRESDIPKINGTLLGKNFKKLKNHDVVEILDTQIEFFYYR